jgi:hypothetical protein
VIRNKLRGELIQSAAVKQAAMGDIGTHAFNMAEYVSWFAGDKDLRRHQYCCRRKKTG